MILRRRFEDRKAAIEVLVQFEYGRDVTAPVAIVRRRPHCQHRFVEMPFVAFHDQLMRSANHVDAIRLIELRHDIAAEQIAGTALANAPTERVLRIGPTNRLADRIRRVSFVLPEQIAHGPIVRYFYLAIDLSDLIESTDRRAEPAVYAEDFPVDHCGQTQIIEHFGTVPPYHDGPVFSQAFVVETVDLGNLPGFVIAA